MTVKNLATSMAETLGDAKERVAETASALAQGAAERVEATADYIREHDAREMLDSVQGYVRKNPGVSLAAAAVVGFLAARALRHD
jgi:ElaB/YqjD/DUF883 family membrane-anchored ribosome-binding protein